MLSIQVPQSLPKVEVGLPPISVTEPVTAEVPLLPLLSTQLAVPAGTALDEVDFFQTNVKPTPVLLGEIQFPPVVRPGPTLIKNGALLLARKLLLSASLLVQDTPSTSGMYPVKVPLIVSVLLVLPLLIDTLLELSCLK